MIYWSIQYFRALAAFTVVLLHAWTRVCGKECTTDYLNFDLLSRFGVELFFVISGIVMWITTSGRTVYPNEFLLKRILRIVPLYYLITLIVATTAYFAPNLLNTAKLDFHHFTYSLMFMPAEHPTSGKLWPLVVPGWSLNYEMFFYTLFSFSLMLPERYRATALCSTIVALCAAGLLFTGDPVYFKFYTHPIMFDFVVGILVGLVITADGQVNKSAAWAKIAAGTLTALIAWMLSSRLTDISAVFSVPAALIVWGVMELEKIGSLPKISWLRWFGDISYSFYLVQMITISAVAYCWKYFGLESHGVANLAYVATALLSTLAVAVLSYRYIELPSQSFGQAAIARVRKFEEGNRIAA
jgi:exopolysaccharide production protein ExoZ